MFFCKYLFKTEHERGTSIEFSKIRHTNNLGGCNLPFTANFNIGRSLGRSPQAPGAGEVDLNKSPLFSVQESAETIRKTKPSHGTFADKHVSFVYGLSQIWFALQVGERHTAGKQKEI